MAKIWGCSHTTHWRGEREGKSGSGRLYTGRMGSATSWWCRFVMVRQNWHCLSPSLMTPFVWRNNPCLHILCARHEREDGERKKRNGRRGKHIEDVLAYKKRKLSRKKNFSVNSTLLFFLKLSCPCSAWKNNNRRKSNILLFHWYLVYLFGLRLMKLLLPSVQSCCSPKASSSSVTLNGNRENYYCYYYKNI